MLPAGIPVRVALAIWVSWCVMHLGAPLEPWRDVLAGLAGLAGVTVTLPGLLKAFGRHLLVILSAVAYAFALCGLGWRVAGWMRREGKGGTERAATSILIGFILAGGWGLGLALSGLFYPYLLAMVLLVSLPSLGRVVGAVRGGLSRLGGRDQRWAGLLLSGPTAIAVVLMFLPETGGDAYTFHLAVPEQLLRIHRFSPESVSVVWQYPLTAECQYALAVAIGMDSLPHFMQFVPFAAGLVLLVAWAAKRGGTTAGWMAALGILTFGNTIRLMEYAKNDLAAAAYPVAAVILLLPGAEGGRFGRVAAAAFLFGCGAAVKHTGLALGIIGWIAIFAMILSDGRRRAHWLPKSLAMGLLPVAPWLLKTWLFTGDPVFPTLHWLFPGSLWDARSTAALLNMGAMYDLPSLPVRAAAGFVYSLLGNQPILAIMAPACLVAAVRGRDGGAFVVGFTMMGVLALWAVMPEPGMRYSLPLFMLWCAQSAVIAARLFGILPGRVRMALVVLAFPLIWLPAGDHVFRSVNARAALDFLAGNIDTEGYRSRQFTTYWEAGEDLARMKGLQGLMVIGEAKSYRLPGRVVVQKVPGRTWSWELARQCLTTREIRIKLRQAACRHVLYNFVTEGYPHPATIPFEWDARMLRLWLDFVARDLDVAAGPRHLDHLNGGFCIYRLRAFSREYDPPFLPYMPGITGLYYGVIRNEMPLRAREWLMSANWLYARLPRVDSVCDLVARGYLALGNWPMAYAFYLPGISHGTINDGNYLGAAAALAKMGRFKESVRLLDRVEDYYPDPGGPVSALKAELKRMIAGEKRAGR